MTTTVLDGKALAAESEHSLRQRLTQACQGAVDAPQLATILVGDDPASATYVRMKGNACRRIGLEPFALQLSATTDTASLLQHIDNLNRNPRVFGILLQHPVPPQIDERACFDAIAAAKDVDGVSCLGFGRMAMGLPAWGAATAVGIMRLLQHYKIEIAGRRAVVVGRSPILGKPVAMMLLNAHATVTICHSRSRDLPELVAAADILVAAVGRPKLIRRDWLRPGSVVVDAGYHPAEKCGDVEPDGIDQIVSAYTPVPGGVGPMTINTLIAQTVAAVENSLPPK